MSSKAELLAKLEQVEGYDAYDALKAAPEELRGDKAVVLKALGRDVTNWQSVSKTFWHDVPGRYCSMPRPPARQQSPLQRSWRTNFPATTNG